jgi:hypothetical protein
MEKRIMFLILNPLPFLKQNYGYKTLDISFNLCKTMKKTFFYNFFPTKEEELACLANNTPHKVTRVLVEIRDVYPPPVINCHDPWVIKKKLTMFEVASGQIVISFHDTFEYIFRYWSFNAANNVVLGNKVPVFLGDLSNPMNPEKFYKGTNVYFEMLRNDDYVLACKDMFQDLCLGIDDEIGLCVPPNVTVPVIMFKLLCKAM